jgi:CheY-like chemotaxis protein
MTFGRPDPPAPLDGVHVLLVEDDARFAGVLATVLECCGALVTTVASPEAARVLMGTVVPGVLVVGTPSAAGAAALLLAPGRAGHRPPALAITAGRGGDAPVPPGFQACLTKPIELGEFCRVVGRVARPPAGRRERLP